MGLIKSLFGNKPKLNQEDRIDCASCGTSLEAESTECFLCGTRVEYKASVQYNISPYNGEVNSQTDYYHNHYQKIKGESKAILINNKKQIAEEIHIRDLAENMKNSNGEILTIILDGIVTQRLVDIASEVGVRTIVATKIGNIRTKPKNIKIIVKDDLIEAERKAKEEKVRIEADRKAREETKRQAQLKKEREVFAAEEKERLERERKEKEKANKRAREEEEQIKANSFETLSSSIELSIPNFIDSGASAEIIINLNNTTDKVLKDIVVDFSDMEDNFKITGEVKIRKLKPSMSLKKTVRIKTLHEEGVFPIEIKITGSGATIEKEYTIKVGGTEIY